MLNNRGFVYLLCDGERFKIGMTKHKDIQKRIKELQTGNPNEIWLHSYYETDYPLKIEKMMHGKHAPSNIKNEWFDLNVSQVFNFKEECKQCEEILKALHDNPFI
jgi:hypothetical protein